MNFLKVILLIADPLLVAFMVSVFIGSFFKESSGKLIAKYSLTFLSAIGYLLLYAYADGVWKNDIVTYIVMFAPLALMLLVIIISLIVAPKGEEAKELDDEDKPVKYLTGWDSMFPNDIDEYDKHPK